MIQEKSTVPKIFFVLLMVCAVLVSVDHTRRWFHSLPTDLRAFYAAGQVIGRHADPFTVQPLLDRERMLAGTEAGQPIVAPVPLPPYGLAALAGLAVLPLPVAAALAAFLTIGAGVVTAFSLYRAAGIPFALAVAVSFTATVYSASGLGQIAPVAIAAIAFATWALRDRRYALAGIALAVSLIQPQIGTAPFVSLLCFVPQARLWAGMCLIVALVASICYVGPSIIAQYAHVLSLHARAEIHFPAQLSLTWLLSFFGVAPGPALVLGSASTIVALLTALVLLARNREQAVANGAVITLPVAFTVVGGSFLHEHQLAVALIPGLLSLRATRTFLDSSWALGILTIPFLSLLTLEPRWPKTSADPSIVLAFFVCWALVYARTRRLDQAPALRKASLVTGIIALVFLVLMKLRPMVHITLPPFRPLANDNASVEWAVFCEAAAAAFHPAVYVLLVKLPVWASVVAIAICSAKNIRDDTFLRPSR